MTGRVGKVRIQMGPNSSVSDDLSEAHHVREVVELHHPPSIQWLGFKSGGRLGG
jgi:hypothetical protein